MPQDAEPPPPQPATGCHSLPQTHQISMIWATSRQIMGGDLSEPFPGLGSSSPQVLQGPTGKPARPQNASIESSSRPSIEFWSSAAEAAAFKFPYYHSLIAR